MTDKVAIKVNSLRKSFVLAESKNNSIKQLFVNVGKKHKKHKKHRQIVLDGIDFEIKKGEFFGIVGRNGSGKSTLLKILAGVYAPDSGAVEINGNLTPFIELGVGFNPELSGKDNVYLSASLLGYARKQVDAMYEDIVSFAELEEHMDKKLKNYSSGMQVRLAFSIAIKAKNDILIFDEVLAVGDEAFQQKCLRVFEEYRQTKQTVVLVTHDMNTVRSLCTRAMLIDDGNIAHIGTVDSVAESYSDMSTRKEDIQERALKGNKNPTRESLFVINPPVKRVYEPSEELSLHVSWNGNFNPNEHIIGVAILRNDGEYIFGSNSRNTRLTRPSFICKIKLDIGPGRYSVTVATLDRAGMLDRKEEAFVFRIIDDGRTDVGGCARLDYTYEEDAKAK